MAYARIDEGFWTDPKIRSLSLEGKLVAAWLFTNPHRHFSGIYYLPKVLIGDEIGVSIGVYEKTLNLLETLEFIKYSHEFSVVWVVNMLKHQSGGKRLSPQQVVGIQKQLATLHGCPLITDFIMKYKELGVNYNGRINTPIDTPIDTKSQSKSQSKSKSQKKDIAPSGPVGPFRALFFSCPYFDVDLDYRIKLSREYSALPDDLLLKEFSRMEDWISDNPGKRKFKANGHLANPKLFIKNWLERITVDGPGTKASPKGVKGLYDYAKRRAGNAD